MQLAVSNIAWEPREDGAVAELLRRHGVGGVEIAPTKWREHPLDATPSDIAAYRRYWEDAGLPIVALQSLLFGHPEMQLFDSGPARQAMLDYLRRMIDLGADLGASALVFGSPKNRRRGSMPFGDAMQIARDFLRELGETARARDVLFCVEANPPSYGCDFITTTAEAVELCNLVGDESVRVNIDLGGMTIEREDARQAIRAAAPLLGHVHASEPHLAELGAADHETAAHALSEIEYAGWVSIEMRAVEGRDNVAAVERAVLRAKGAYGR